MDQLRLSCTARATQAEKAGFVPATQPAAATLAALMAEATIPVAHGNKEIVNRRVYLNTRTAKATTVRLTRDEHCQGRHAWPDPSFEVSVGSESRVGQLLDQLSERLQSPTVFLPHRFVAAAPCGDCDESVVIDKPDWALPGSLLCERCGGPLKQRNGTGNGSLPLEIFTTISEATPRLVDLPLSTIGIVPGSLLEAETENGDIVMFRVSGSIFPTPVR